MVYKYPMQKIVDYKNSIKTQAEWKLTEALSQLNTENEKMSKLQLEKNSRYQQFHATIKEKTQVSELQNMSSYILYLNDHIEKQHEDLKTAHVAVTSSKDHLKKKMIDEKVWVNAKEKSYTEFKEKTYKKETIELDEIGMRVQR
ncbi:flagellar export protein FliJ [Chengkuizengella axinellae]|uniref:Flagellar FliJ protein n=1 Tax=Chengkuizengella axinellae TaxID=3064388 RepID=A0ABT9IVR1_9BACL|nr:flagellar export protein FliJ [Chengkuizengella sp. 2205SS18-9]MDP5273441.1 flagellar export protein FliJ [Chengkuizengella sp. 2205SS18-9]